VLARIVLLLVLLALAAAPAPAQDAPPPKIEFQSPPDSHKTDEASVAVTAVITDERGIRSVRVSVNGERVALDNAPSPSAPPRSFRVNVEVPIVLGENVIGISATSMAAKITQAARTVMRIPPAVAGPQPKKLQRYAVIIGVGAYDHTGIPALRFGERDAQALHDLLIKGGYPKENVALLSDASATKPTLQNIQAALGNLRRATKDDAVLFYYSGRGAREPDTTGRERDGFAKYITARDTEPDALFSTALRLNEFEERIIPRIRAGRLVMLFDADWSGNAAGRSFQKQVTRSATMSPEFLERLTRSSGRVLINAASGNESALDAPDFRHGVFTYFLVQGLDGGADRDKDGIVTVPELYTFIQGRVGEYARKAGTRQTPLLDGALSDLPLLEVPKR
jgi:hypothetical protein